MKHKIKYGYLKWRETTDILCDKIVLILFKDKLCKKVMRPAMIYGSEC